MSATRSKAEERYAELQRRELGIKEELASAERLRAQKTARLRELRLAKEAQEAQEAAAKRAAKQEALATAKGARKKVRVKGASA